jgi:hypothetical protein
MTSELNKKIEGKGNNRSGVLNLGGLTVSVLKGQGICIGPGITIIAQDNNSPGSKRINFRIIAPKNVVITKVMK